MEKSVAKPLVINGNRLIKVEDPFFADDIIIPEGVEIIGEGAAYGNHASKIVLPESLKCIESDAFGDMNEIYDPVHIPAGVEYIAVDAFSDARDSAFCVKFTVDDNNPHYFSEGGVLYEKDRLESDVYGNIEVFSPDDSNGGQFIRPWSIVSFGTYPQTASGDDRTPIEWLVLDVREGRALLISRYALDSLVFDDGSRELMTWEYSTLRSWLEKDFINTAFSVDEQRRICDTVYALSKTEAEDCFMNRQTGRPDYAQGTFVYNDTLARQCLATPYASARGADTDENTAAFPGQPCVSWWTSEYCFRHGGTYAYYVTAEGEFSMISPFVKGIAVRPALWIRIPE